MATSFNISNHFDNIPENFRFNKRNRIAIEKSDYKSAQKEGYSPTYSQSTGKDN